MNDAEGSHLLHRMARAILDLLDHPFPHDLMKLRLRVASEYGGDDSAAKAEMEEWCSQEMFDQHLDAYIEARKAGNAIIAEYDPNVQSDEEAIALGFSSAHTAKKHADWMAEHGTQEYKAWLRKHSPNAQASYGL